MAIKATLRMRDSFGSEITKRVETNETVLADAIDAISGVGGYLTSLAAVTDLQYLGATFSEKDDTGAFAGTGTSNADVGATFTVLTTTGKRASHKVPGFPLSLVGAGREIDVSGAEVVAYFAHFISGSLRLSDGEAVASVLSGSLDI